MLINIRKTQRVFMWYKPNKYFNILLMKYSSHTHTKLYKKYPKITAQSYNKKRELIKLKLFRDSEYTIKISCNEAL